MNFVVARWKSSRKIVVQSLETHLPRFAVGNLQPRSCARKVHDSLVLLVSWCSDYFANYITTAMSRRITRNERAHLRSFRGH